MSYLNYSLFRIATFPIQFLPYSLLHKLGSFLGIVIYFCYPRYRKRALSNLALATSLNLTPDQVVALAKKSMQNLAITALEYPRLYRENDISKIAFCENPEKADSLMSQGRSVIFFVGHQANWEILFLEGTSRMPGVAIGRPIANAPLYRWTLRLREKFGGKIIPPKDAYRSSVKALKAGKFLGIVGDQGMPNSGFSSPFLGRDAYTSPLPALLSKRTGSPIIVATIRREEEKYIIHYSDPIEPQEDTNAQMGQVLALFEKSIQERPHEWLWIHNKWKQQLPGRLKKPFRHDAVAFVFGTDPEALEWLPQLRLLYPTEQLTAFIPESLTPPENSCEIKIYHTLTDILTPDYRFKLVVDFTNTPLITKHFAKLGALQTFQFSHPRDYASQSILS
jgi:KDO2-lipid IV(A) lauroyltransferase